MNTHSLAGFRETTRPSHSERRRPACGLTAIVPDSGRPNKRSRRRVPRIRARSKRLLHLHARLRAGAATFELLLKLSAAALLDG